jgi:hypothetical protein
LGELPGKPGQVAKCRHCGSDIHWGDGKPYKTIKDATAAKKKVVPVFEEFKTSKPELGRDEDTPKRATLERGTFEDLPWSDSKTPGVQPRKFHEYINDWIIARRRKSQLLREKEPSGLKDWWYALYLWQKACFYILALLLFSFPVVVATVEVMKAYSIGPFDLSRITAATARSWVKNNNYELNANRLTSIDKDVAQELVKFEGEALYLNGLKSIDKDVAQELVKFKGNNPRP